MIRSDNPLGGESQGADKSYDGSDSSISLSADAYCVIVVSPYGNPRRRLYLSLHHATEAVRRAHAKGQPAHMVLCRLEPVAADLDESWPT
jgi:hypothetical protein